MKHRNIKLNDMNVDGVFKFMADKLPVASDIAFVISDFPIMQIFINDLW